MKDSLAKWNGGQGRQTGRAQAGGAGKKWETFDLNSVFRRKCLNCLI